MKSLGGDINRMIYQYLHNDLIVKNIKKVIHRTVTKMGNENMMFGKNCKLCCQALKNEFFEDTIWEGVADPWFFAPQSKLCYSLKLCQDYEYKWFDYFDSKFKFSVVNGVVYRLELIEDRYHLIPFFSSNHCWQDIAARIIRFKDRNSNNRKCNEDIVQNLLSKLISKNVV